MPSSNKSSASRASIRRARRLLHGRQSRAEAGRRTRHAPCRSSQPSSSSPRQWISLPPPSPCTAGCNRPYEWRFLRGLLKRSAARSASFPTSTPPIALAGIRSLWDFDDRITAYYCRLLRCGGLLPPRLRNARRRPHRRAHAASSTPRRSLHPHAPPTPATSSSPTRTSPWLRRVTEATAPSSPPPTHELRRILGRARRPRLPPPHLSDTSRRRQSNHGS